jgi:hypothetical protein
MLGRKTYTQEELDRAQAAMAAQVTAYRNLVDAVASGTDTKAGVALEAFEPLFFNNLTVALDRFFVYRLRVVTGKNCNPINEVELIAASVMADNGVLQGSNVIKYRPEESVLQLAVGDPIRLTVDDFERLAEAFFAVLERKFVAVGG